MYQYCFHTFAGGTKASYRTHRTSYLRFCEHMGYPPLPAQSSHLCQYTAILACSLKATSVPNYLNSIGILHKESNLPNPLPGNWPLQSLGLSVSRVCNLPKNNPLPLAFWVKFIRISTCALVLMLASGLYVLYHFLVCFAKPSPC